MRDTQSVAMATLKSMGVFLAAGKPAKRAIDAIDVLEPEPRR